MEVNPESRPATSIWCFRFMGWVGRSIFRPRWGSWPAICAARVSSLLSGEHPVPLPGVERRAHVRDLGSLLR